MIRRMALAAALIGLGLVPTTGEASISFTIGAGGSPNVNLDYRKTGDMTAIGSLIGTTTDVLSITTDASLNVPSGGQATIEAATSTLFSQIRIDDLAGGFVLGGFEANPQTAPGGTTGFFYLVATDNFGASFDSRTQNGGNAYQLRRGQNFFTALASDNQTIQSLTIFASSSRSGTPTARIIESLSQVRIEAGTVAPVPEPATLVSAFMGLALVGAGGLRRRLRSRKVSN